MSSELNSQQLAVVRHTTGPLLIVAGAGTGKTHVLTERVCHLIDSEACQPYEILILAFNDDAANELEGRILERLPLGSSFPEIITFHAWCLELVKTYGLEIGLNTSGETLDDIGKFLLIYRNFSTLPLSYFLTPHPSEENIRKFLRHFSALKSEGLSPTQYTEYVKSHPWETETERRKYTELAALYAAYEDLKRQAGVLDFDDFHYYALEILRTRPHILSATQKRYKYLLVDEYQDTDPVQNHLINLLSAPHGNLTVVGDDDQCIYRFRGASIENILEFKNNYPQAKEVTLTENYRSTQEILDLAYKVIQYNNPHRLEAKLHLDKHLHAQTASSESITYTKYDHGLEEYAALITQIENYLTAGREPKDIAILVRTRAQGENLAYALGEADLPYQFSRSRGLYAVPEVERLLFAMRAICSPYDPDLLYHFLTLPLWNIPQSETYELYAQAVRSNISLYSLLQKTNYTTAQTFLKEMSELTRTANASELVMQILERTGWKAELLAAQDSVEGQKQILNVAKFLRLVNDFCRQNQPNALKDYLDYQLLRERSGEDPRTATLDDNISAITIGTVHSAKGLEWPIVFLPGLYDGGFPTTGRNSDIAFPPDLATQVVLNEEIKYAEERRLFYVAATRAKEHLHLSYSDFYDESKRAKQPSTFLVEAGLATHTAKPKGKTAKPEKKLNPLPAPVRNEDLNPTALAEFNMRKFSHSTLIAYETCPRKLYYLKVANFPTLPGAQQSFGTQIHNTLRDFLAQAKSDHTQPSLFPTREVSLESLLHTWETRFSYALYADQATAKKYFELGKNICQWFYADWKNGKPLPLYLEKKFELPMGDFFLTGAFDRIDPGSANNLCEIIDYKTGKTKTEVELRRDSEEIGFQLSIYALGAQALGLTPEKLTVYYLKDGEKISTTRDTKQLDKTRDKVVKLVDQIRKKDFTATPGSHCQYCDFAALCPYAQKN